MGALTTAAEEKRAMYQRWWEAHRPTMVPLLDPSTERYELSAAAQELLNSATAAGLYVYVVAEHKDGFHVPLYIGKSVSPAHRWRDGHMCGLNNHRLRRYEAWRSVLSARRQGAFFYLLHESQIVQPPLPSFPHTVGSVEYQLVALATDFSPQLLNREGVPR